MTESQRLARHGLMILSRAGWPEDKAKELMELFMQAGFALCLEKQEALRKENEALIERAVIQ